MGVADASPVAAITVDTGPRTGCGVQVGTLRLACSGAEPVERDRSAARCCVTQCSTSGTASAKSGLAPSSAPWLAASAGMPSVTAWRAAPTVPEIEASGPMF